MNRTGIEYLDFTWSPIAMRCTPVGPGCANCWHLRMADRLAGNSAFPEDVRAAYAGKGPPVLVEKRLDEPLRRKKPALIGVQFMGDLFHERVCLLDLHDLWLNMEQAAYHTFLVLTKRPHLMMDFCEWFYGDHKHPWILPNVWLGVSVENQKAANERTSLLVKTPAAMKIISLEPLLGPVDLYRAVGLKRNQHGHAVMGETIDLVIVGGESGPGARPMHPQWARDVRDQCQEAGVSYFMKQWGEYLHESQFESPYQRWLFEKAKRYRFPGHEGAYVKVGKAAAGRLLDGALWDEMPDAIRDTGGADE